VIRPQLSEYYRNWAFSIAVERTRLPNHSDYRERAFSPPRIPTSSSFREYTFSLRTSVTLANASQGPINVWTATVRPAQRTIKPTPVRAHADQRSPNDAPTVRHRANPRYAFRCRGLSRDRLAVRYVIRLLAWGITQSQGSRNHQYCVARISCERLHRSAINCYLVHSTLPRTHIVSLNSHLDNKHCI